MATTGDAEVKLSERLEKMAKSPYIAPFPTRSQTLREAAELARRVEDAPVVEIDSEAGEDVRLIAEGGPLDRMTTSVRVLSMHGQRVRLVPDYPTPPDPGHEREGRDGDH